MFGRSGLASKAARQSAQRSSWLGLTIDAVLTGEGCAAPTGWEWSHAERLAHAGPAPDAEQALLDHLAVLKRAVAEGVEGEPDLRALRNVLADMFESVELVRSGRFGTHAGEGRYRPRCAIVPAGVP
jgi:hypothetical protein